MTTIYPRCLLWGDTFSPRLCAERTGLRFTNANEVGDIASIGRYKGTPFPNGRATLKPPFDLSTGLEDMLPECWLLDTVTLHLQELRSCGATDIVLHFYVT
jgi:hypothetical protein